MKTLKAIEMLGSAANLLIWADVFGETRQSLSLIGGLIVGFMVLASFLWTWRTWTS